MGKCITIGLLGFLLGMKCKECCKTMYMKQMKKQLMKKFGL